MPLAHVSLPVSDLQASKAFYLNVLKPLGYGVFMEVGSTIGLGPKHASPDFWLHKCPEDKHGHDGAKSQKTHVAFQADSVKKVHAFYEAALKSGATCNGPPGERPQYTKGYYAAYVFDPDGNNIECMHWQPLWLTVLQKAPVMLGVLAVGGFSWWAGKQGWMMGG